MIEKVLGPERVQDKVHMIEKVPDQGKAQDKSSVPLPLRDTLNLERKSDFERPLP